MLPAIRNNHSLTPATERPVNRLSNWFDSFFNDDFFAPLAAAPLATIPLSMWDDEHNVYAEIDAPGVAEKDVEVTVHDGELIVKGERKSERKEGGCDSRSDGKFEQRVTLPCPVDADRVEAKLSRGVLSMTLPKSEAAKPKKIALKAE